MRKNADFRDSEDKSFFETENVASASECTGLIPALPVNDPDAMEDLAQMYAIHAPKKRNGARWEGSERVQR